MSSAHDPASAAHDSAPAASPAPELGGPQGAAPLALPLPTVSRLLADPAIQGRGNGPVRQAAILQLQRTHGNRAVQRALAAFPRRPASAAISSSPLPIQRMRKGDVKP